jgi:hypothetical protein
MRPHISHVDGHALAWQEILNTGVHRKQLSVDPDTGSDTSFVRVPADWHGPAGAHYHTGFEEALILSGDVDLNGNDLLVEGSYLYRPGGGSESWQPWEGAAEGIEKKSLSLDETNGAETMLARIPQGFSGSFMLAPDITWEWVVLVGGMSLADGTAFDQMGYSHRPAGSEETVIAQSESDCTLMMWAHPG